MTSPGAMPMGADTLARQWAKEALGLAQTARGETAARLSGCRLGSGKTGLLVAVGGTTDVAVTWSSPITVAYSVEAVAGPGLIGTAILAVKSQTSTGCVITVAAQGLAIAVGAVVFAHATF